ncbi:hypothetical protein [Tropheryma whipplei]|uniref:hypothetical protein n=1 Tax=Tropheryma whipplei TaxID=2039 RepID=UPI0004AD6C19|nr:hypothetical protein [Tropheryma whipplei]
MHGANGPDRSEISALRGSVLVKDFQPEGPEKAMLKNRFLFAPITPQSAPQSVMSSRYPADFTADHGVESGTGVPQNSLEAKL